MKNLKDFVPIIATLVLVLVAASLLTQPTSGANNRSQDTRRAFYLTKEAHTGSETLAACVAGYHMASIWEILDPSNLRYDTTLGRTVGDSGFGGPPTVGFENGAGQAANYVGLGWIRTGTGALANCNGWTSDAHADSGSYSLLKLSASAELTFNWVVGHELPCDGVGVLDFQPGVWCVQD
jgi:hypothetical protein